MSTYLIDDIILKLNNLYVNYVFLYYPIMIYLNNKYQILFMLMYYFC